MSQFVDFWCKRARFQPRHNSLWIPGWLLFGGSVLVFLVLHLRSVGWAPGLLFDVPSAYWHWVISLVGKAELYASRTSPYLTFHRLLLASALLAAGGSYALAVVRVRRRSSDIYLRSILVWTTAFCLPLLLLPNLLSGDIYSYIMFGRIPALHGGNPFIEAPAYFPADPFVHLVGWRYVPSVYGPVWILLSQSLTGVVEFLGGALWQYILAYKLMAVVPHLISTALLWSILGQWKPQQQGWGTVLYAWNPLALIEFAGSAHNDALMIALLLLALWLHLRQRPSLAVLALVAAMLIKWVVAALIPLYGLLVLWEATTWRARLRFVALSGASSLALMVLTYAPYWAGRQTLDILFSAPPSTRMVNSLGELAAGPQPDHTTGSPEPSRPPAPSVEPSSLAAVAPIQPAIGGEPPSAVISILPAPHLLREDVIPRDSMVRQTGVSGQVAMVSDGPTELSGGLSDEHVLSMRNRAAPGSDQTGVVFQRYARLEQIAIDDTKAGPSLLARLRDPAVIRLAGYLLLTLVWLWSAWRVRTLQTLVQSWAWTLFVYISLTSIWFWPWYVTWFVALAALLDWRRGAVTAILFSVSASMIYVTYAFTNTPTVIEQYRAVIVFGPPLLYLAGTLPRRLRQLAILQSFEAERGMFPNLPGGAASG